MRKFALLIAAAVIMSVPLLATSPTESVAATKSKGMGMGMGTAKGMKGAPEESGGSLFQAFADQLSGRGGETKTKQRRARRRGMGMGE